MKYARTLFVLGISLNNFFQTPRPNLQNQLGRKVTVRIYFSNFYSVIYSVLRGIASTDVISPIRVVTDQDLSMIRSKHVEPAIIPEPPAPVASPQRPQPAPIAAAPTNTTPSAIIGPKIRFKGELVGEEDLIIQGQVEGTIDLRDNNLTIGSKGSVKANVLAKTIIIEGRVEGDIYGRERIAIKASSNVKGNLVAERVTLEDGAKFKGSIDMDINEHKSKFEPQTKHVAHAVTREEQALESELEPA